MFGYQLGVDGAVPPEAGKVLNREPMNLPEAQPSDIDLIEMVSAADKELHQLGLKNLGLPEKTLLRLRGLEGLARSSGNFLAISLETTHRSYYLQLIELMGLAKDLQERLSTPAGQDGYIADAEQRAWFNKNYIEMVKEAGRGFELSLTAAQAMVKMMVDTKGLEMPGGSKKKPGWGIVKAKKVQPA